MLCTFWTVEIQLWVATVTIPSSFKCASANHLGFFLLSSSSLPFPCCHFFFRCAFFSFSFLCSIFLCLCHICMVFKCLFFDEWQLMHFTHSCINTHFITEWLENALIVSFLFWLLIHMFWWLRNKSLCPMENPWVVKGGEYMDRKPQL